MKLNRKLGNRIYEEIIRAQMRRIQNEFVKKHRTSKEIQQKTIEPGDCGAGVWNLS